MVRISMCICLIGQTLATLSILSAETGEQQNNKTSMEWTWTRDTFGRVTEVKGPGGSAMCVVYAVETNATSGETTDVVSYGKDSRRLTYDKAGRLARASGGAAGVAITYGTNRLPAEVKTEGCPALRYGYDALGQLTELHIGAATVLRYRYDYQGRLSAISTPAGEITYTYRPGQNMVIRKLPNKVLTHRLYDDEGRLKEITHVDAGNMIIQRYLYAYRPDGLVDTSEEGGGTRGARATRYTYDVMHRLVGVANQGEGTASFRYAYDELGNLAEAKSDAGDALRLTSTPAGALKSDSRGACRTDARGHVRELPFGDGTIDYAYAENGKLASAKGQSVTYAYDALERLTERTVAGRATRYLPDPLSDTWQPLWRRDAAGNETVTVWDNGVPLLEIRGQRVTYRLEDRQGSVRVELDAAGQVAAWRDYSPYGKPATLRDGDDLQLGFAGLPYDPVAGVYLTLARAYDPVTARFLQPDPQLRIPGASPQTHSLYAYCAGNPVNWVDRDGAEAKPCQVSYAEADDLIIRQLNNGNMIKNIWDYGLPTKEGNVFGSGREYEKYQSVHVPGIGNADMNWRVITEVQPSIEYLTPIPHLLMAAYNLAEYTGIYDMAGVGKQGKPDFSGFEYLKVNLNPFQSKEVKEFYRQRSTWPTVKERWQNTLENTRGYGIGMLNSFIRDVKAIDDFICPPAYGDEIHNQSRPTSPAPVGGVYLGGAGKALEGLGALVGIAVDEATGNLVLVGEDGRSSALPPLRLDDVVTVFRAVYDHGQSPTVTIDPDEKNPKGPIMHVVHGPGTEGTYVGWVLFECDRVMKTYQLGTDNVTRQPIESSIPGHAETVNTVFFGNNAQAGVSTASVWERFWIVPAAVRRYDAAAHGLSLLDVPLKVNTQKMMWEKGKLVDDENGKSSPGAEAFKAWFSKNYDLIAEEVRLQPPQQSGLKEPVAIFKELRRIATVTAVAERLRDQGQALPLWMRDYPVAAFPVATTTPSLNLSCTNGLSVAKIYGGVNLAPADEDVHAYGQTEGVKKVPESKADIAFVEAAKPKVSALTARISEVARLPLAAERPIKIAMAGGEKVAAIALPGATSQALAPNQQSVSDMSVPVGLGRSIRLTRQYSSFFDPEGECGKGWTLNLPTLKITSVPVSFDGKKGDSRPVPYLSSPLGTYNIRFDKLARVAQCNNSELYVAKDHPEIAGVALGNSLLFGKVVCKVLFQDASEWHFDMTNGFLLAQQSEGVSTCYERDATGRVSRIVGFIGKQMMGAIVLIYDAKGRIEKACAEQPDALSSQLPADAAEIAYEYGKDNRLLAVLQRQSSTGDAVRVASYSYMGSQLIDMQGTDKRKQTFVYNKQGQVTKREQDGQSIDYALTAVDGKTTFTQSAAGGKDKVSTVYDGQLRPVAMEVGKEAEVRWEYGAGKSAVERVIEKGRTLVTRKISSDGKTETEIDHETGESYKVERDESGQPSALSYNGAQVVTVDRSQSGALKSVTLGRTTEVVPLVNEEGWQNGLLVKDPNSETLWTQQEWDVLGRPIKIEDSTGFEYVLSYDAAGRLRSCGRPTKDGSLTGSLLSYDATGRVTGVESSWGKEQREYAKGGLLSKVVSKRGGAVAEQRFDGLGRPAISRAYDGGETMWTYASNEPAAALASITLPNKKKIDYSESATDKGSTITTRMGSVVAELKSDATGRTTSLKWASAQ